MVVPLILCDGIVARSCICIRYFVLSAAEAHRMATESFPSTDVINTVDGQSPAPVGRDEALWILEEATCQQVQGCSHLIKTPGKNIYIYIYFQK